MASKPSRLGRLSDEKRELIAALARRRGSAAAPPALIIPRVDRSAPLPLSFAQEQLWFLCRLRADSALYNMPVVLRIRGEIDVEALHKSLAHLVARHEVLRTRYVVSGDGPVALVDATATVPFEHHATSSAADSQARVDRFIRLPFSLERGPIARAAVYSEEPRRHLLVLVIHHIACDQWALGVLQRDLWRFYDAELKGSTIALSPPPFDYVDYAAWQRARARDGAFDDDLAYWRPELLGVPPTLRAPGDRAPRGDGARACGEVAVGLTHELLGRVRTFAKEADATPFMVIMAALQLLLSRVGDQTDVAVGAPIANRDAPGSEQLLGYFVNTIVLRGDLSGDPSFRELCERIKKTAMAAYAHAAVPFPLVVEAVNPERSAEDNPLFQCMLVYDDAATIEEPPGLSIEPLAAQSGLARFDLVLLVAPELRDPAYLLYARALFDDATAAELGRRFVRFLEQALLHPAARLSTLALVDEPDGDRLAQLCAGPEVALPEDVVAQFARLARLDGAAAAVVFGSYQATRGEIAVRAADLARTLRARGVRRGDVVAVLMGHSIEVVVSVVAILSCGAAYLPIDPRNPRERAEFMLASSRSVLVLTDARYAKVIPSTMDGPVVPFLVVDTADAQPAPAPDGELLGCELLPSDVSYVIFTSGSTGQPKGSMNTHAGLANNIQAVSRMLDLGPDDRVLQSCSLGFDASLQMIALALTSGATLVLAHEDELLPGPHLGPLLATLGITATFLLPSIAAMLDAREVPNLRALIFGGESCSPELVEAWSGGRRLFNGYGPSEAAMSATSSEARDGRFAGIGRPFDNVRSYAVDRFFRHVPLGAAGELLLAGAGLARGYIGQPGLTAERFLPDPFATRPGERLYRTGDLVRFRGDDSIEFLGRVDQQVKVRGQRVELSECEGALSSHPGVQEAAVTARAVGAGGSALAAYIVAAPDHDPEAAELRDYLRGRLPDYMVPSFYVRLAALPRTRSGKVDRRALPAPRAVTEEDSYAPPRNEVEESLVAIWQDALEKPRVGIHDEYFELGGTSFLIIKLLTAVERRFGCRLPMSTVFDYGTVAKMAELVSTTIKSDAAAPARVPLSRGSGAPLFVVHPLGGNVLCYGTLARILKRPVVGFQARGIEDRQPPRDDIVDMAGAYARELTASYPNGPCTLLGWSFGGTVAYEMACQLSQQGREVPMVFLLDSDAPRTRETPPPAMILARMLYDLSSLLGVNMPSYETLQSASPEERTQMAVDVVKKAQLFPKGQELAEIQRYLAIYNAHVVAATTYEPRPFDGRALYLTAAASERRRGTMELWRSLIRDFEEAVLPGARHNNLLLQPHVAHVAEILLPRLVPIDKSAG
jgi:amino acid adenylation domain-containing protein